MFSCINDEKIFQTLPGQGWRVLIEWDCVAELAEEGHPAMTLEPVIAWVTARVQRVRKRDGHKYEDVIIAPLVRETLGNELILLDVAAPHERGSFKSFVYVAPGEDASEQIKRLDGEYASGVTLG